MSVLLVIVALMIQRFGSLYDFHKCYKAHQRPGLLDSDAIMPLLWDVTSALTLSEGVRVVYDESCAVVLARNPLPCNQELPFFPQELALSSSLATSNT